MLVRTAVEPAGRYCAAGGTRFDAGSDTDGNGVLDDPEVTVTSYVCDGVTGASSLVRTTAEPPGGNCAAGGFRIQSGADADGNGSLDDAEVSMTTYACLPVPGLRSACEDARPLVPGVAAGDLTDRLDTFLGCRISGAPGALRIGEGTPDQAWSLYLERRSLVSVHAVGRDLALYVRRGSDCATSGLVSGACSDVPAAQGEVLSQVLEAGQYWVIVEGDAATGGSYDIDLRISDPCGEERPSGRCEGPQAATWCIVPPAGVHTTQTAYVACEPGETCRTVGGKANCYVDPATTTCTGEATFCRDENTLVTCNGPGPATPSNCPLGCKEDGWRLVPGCAPAPTVHGPFQVRVP